MNGPTIFAEGGGNDDRELKIRCREGFQKLLEGIGLPVRSFKVLPCGSRNEAFRNFQTALRQGKIAYVALLVDSEDLVSDGEKPWDHLKSRDDWDRPAGAADEQVFLMTTCMETWVVADQEGLRRDYEHHQRCLQPAGLPSTVNLETEDRHQVQQALMTATKGCRNAYAKNKRSFEVLANVNPAVLRRLLPAFAHMERILSDKL